MNEDAIAAMARQWLPDLRMVVIGGSAGGIEVLTRNVLPQVSSEFSLPIVVVLHLAPDHESHLSTLLGRATSLPVSEVEDKTLLESGHIYCAPPNYHLLFDPGFYTALSVSEEVNYSRPSIDVAFESAALEYGANQLGILLSGASSDGAEGLKKIQLAGGKTVVQSPGDAEAKVMPQAAIDRMSPDAVLASREIGLLLKYLGD